MRPAGESSFGAYICGLGWVEADLAKHVIWLSKDDQVTVMKLPPLLRVDEARRLAERDRRREKK